MITKYSVVLQFEAVVLRMFFTREKLPPSREEAVSKNPPWKNKKEKRA